MKTEQNNKIKFTNIVIITVIDIPTHITYILSYINKNDVAYYYSYKAIGI